MALTISSSTARVTSAAFGLTSGSITTAAFTPSNTSLLVACIESDGKTIDGTGTPAFTCAGGGWTWVKQTERIDTDSGGLDGGAVIYTAAVTTGASMTVTATNGAPAGNDEGPISLHVYQVVDDGGSRPEIGAVGEGSSTTNNITPTVLISQAASSVLVVAANDWSAGGTPVSSDLTEDGWTVALSDSGMDGYKTLGGAGSQTANIDAGGAAAAVWDWCALEVKIPAGAQDTPELYGRPYGNRGSDQQQQLLAQ